MPNSFIARTVSRARVLRRLPAARLLALAEVAVLAREHLNKLDSQERRRLVELVGRGRTGPRHLTQRERRELTGLLAKAEPRLFMTRAVEKIAGVPLWTRDRGRR
jgi:hypothetical protein